jgi:hypothetical protein
MVDNTVDGIGCVLSIRGIARVAGFAISRRSESADPGGGDVASGRAPRGPPRPQLDEEKSGRWQRDHSHAQSQNVAFGRLLHHEETTRRCMGNSAFKIPFPINKGPNLLLQIHYVLTLMITPRTLLREAGGNLGNFRS